jgi:hypothetical protein
VFSAAYRPIDAVTPPPFAESTVVEAARAEAVQVLEECMTKERWPKEEIIWEEGVREVGVGWHK